MLVIISDLHLTDGTSGETIRSNAFRVFRERLRDMAYDASWRSNEKYEPIKELDVVLLGDIFDVIRSTSWLSDDTRPWSEKNALFKNRVKQITQDIVKNNEYSLGVLREISDGKTITLPPATRDGKVASVSRDPASTERQPVDVRVRYMVGNHDWFYHLAGDPAFDQMRKTIVDAGHLASQPNAPFPHDACESAELAQTFRDHGVVARHGDIFDSLNFQKDRNSSSLGDAIVIELLNRFPFEVARQVDDLPETCTAGLREMDNVRPLLIIPVWLEGLLRRTCTHAQADKVKHIWDGLVDCFLAVPFVKNHRSVLHFFGDVARLEWALKFSKGVSLGNLGHLASWLIDKLGVHDADFYPNAFKEEGFENRSARYIVYGHTHKPEIVPLDSTSEQGKILNQLYMNSGTWRAVHERTRWRPSEMEFIGYHVMTYLAFFKGTERGGREFETWSGSLATHFPM